MGIVHVLGALGRFLFGKKKYPDYKSKLAKYLLTVGIYFLIMIVFLNVDVLSKIITNSVGFIYIGIIPWFIAGYYWTIIYGGPEEVSNTETHSLITNN